jgi:hypothetical protein
VLSNSQSIIFGSIRISINPWPSLAQSLVFGSPMSVEAVHGLVLNSSSAQSVFQQSLGGTWFPRPILKNDYGILNPGSSPIKNVYEDIINSENGELVSLNSVWCLRCMC